MDGIVKGQVFVDFIGEHQQIVPDDQLAEFLQRGLVEDCPGGVVGAVDDDHRGAFGHGGVDGRDIQLPAVGVGTQRNRYTLGAGHGDRGGVGVVVGLEDDDLTAGLHETEHGRGDRLGGAHGDQHLCLRRVAQPVPPGALLRHRPAQPRISAAGAVLIISGRDFAAGDLEHLGGAVRIRETLPEVDRLVFDRFGGHRGEHGFSEGTETFDHVVHVARV